MSRSDRRDRQGRCVVGIPDAIIPVLQNHMNVFVKDEPGLHFHDLRHTGKPVAAQSDAALRDLMARMGHDSERASPEHQAEIRAVREELDELRAW